MQGYSALEVFTGRELVLRESARRLVDLVPELQITGEVNTIRCHELARAIGLMLHLPVTDGKYGPVEHSWCWTRQGQGGECPGNILDVYSIGRLPMVQLVEYSGHGSWVAPNRDLYRCYPFERSDIRDDVVKRLLEFWFAQDSQSVMAGPSGTDRGMDCTGANGPGEPPKNATPRNQP